MVLYLFLIKIYYTLRILLIRPVVPTYAEHLGMPKSVQF